MTREEAVRWFKESPFYHENHEPFNMAIEALSEPSGDLISRADAIDTICIEWCLETFDNCPHADDGFRCVGCDDVEALMALPSAEAKTKCIAQIKID